MTFKDDVKAFLGYELSELQLNKFAKYFDFLIEYNQITNLTRITNEKEVYYKHFFDSITILKFINLTNIDSLCDIGAGAGFPSIPIKILYPNIKLTIVDSLGKRIHFLHQLIKLIDIDGIELVNDRVEIFGMKNQNKFDIVTARALGHLRLISEMAIPIVKTSGHFVAFKASNYEDEISESQRTIQILGGKIEAVHKLDLPYNFGFRSHIMIKKISHKNGFPRSYQQMIKKPL